MSAAAAEAERAAQLVAMGLRRTPVPDRDPAYRELLARYGQDEDFAQLVHGVAGGLGLLVLDVNRTAGLVLAADRGSVFETKLEDYFVRRDRSEGERVLHGVIHLAIAALAFPGSAELANDSFVNRVSVEQVDVVVRETCRMLEERAAREGTDLGDPPVDRPGLDFVWRAYQRKQEVSSTKDNRLSAGSTRGMVSRALHWLAKRGLLNAVGEDADGVFRTTSRYQIQVRQLAAHTAFQELLELGVVPPLRAEFRISSSADQAL
jgi:hypothetical protein